MASMFREHDGGLEWRGRHETLRVEPWGPDALRVRAVLGAVRDDIPGALLDRPAPGAARITVPDLTGRRVFKNGLGSPTDALPPATVVNGRLTAEITAEGELRFTRTGDDGELLAERRAHFWWPGTRVHTPVGHGHQRLEQYFAAYEGERLYGLGQHQQGRLDRKNTVVDLVQRNTEITIPFVLSSRGYGLLWNSPAVGRVELADSGTRWVADSARQIDYWITAGDTPADILRHYADATGHAPEFPEWATGFWQCKLRYRTQAELLEVAREHKRRGLPMSVIVADFFHWTRLGDWKFDPEEWPDPAAMVTELDELGIRLMVSIWPSVNQSSENYDEMERRGLFAANEYGTAAHATWIDKGSDSRISVAFLDPTNPEARAYVWDKVRRNYQEMGINLWWLDACEPEMKPAHPANLRYHAGHGQEVANLYPREIARAFHEGMAASGNTDGMSFARSAWAGSQRYGTAVWSGDIGTDFAALRTQIAAGLSIGLSGIPWWTTDIGGFHGGDPDDPAYREVIVRWFQFGAFCPIFRLHGFRVPWLPLGGEMTGGPNEVWSYGPEAYEVMCRYLRLRERIRPYVAEQMRTAAREGLPVMRPLFLEFPADDACWTVTDQYLLGPDLLVAPVTGAGAVAREVYLPRGARWRCAWTGVRYEGSTTVTVDAPLDRIPLLLRDDATLPIAEA
ncbi:glycoside hydrolase family 31 protein [Streptomyces litchfieldiae]|uniref:Glycoside hydrolase family 31 protein n=1 Tax=Streptomyces litchfieldiae TaxID=3075543 RepID=A0ABU2MPL8_9ACTN|nr:glycoside hydrolase family 31 protein [Streptomyces sp. DSM 44938]MDT0343495.1 glycoside hydrolase family 31 protein [Streptomyces sp. DSM 44938]